MTKHTAVARDRDDVMDAASATWQDLDVPGADTLVDYVRHHATGFEARVVYSSLNGDGIEGDALTFAELDRRSRLVGAALQQADGFGKRALLLYPTGMEFVTAFFGALYAGVVPVPLPVPRRADDLGPLERVALDCDASFVLTTKALGHAFEPAAAERSCLHDLTWLRTDALTPCPRVEEWVMPDITADTLALLQYTSGSTRTPRGVMITHGNLLHNSRAIQAAMQTSPATRIVTWLPHYHDMGLIGTLIQPIYCRGTSTVMPPVAFLQRPLLWLQAISNLQAYMCGAPNFAYDLCIRRTTPPERARLDLSHWQVAFCGAEPIRQQTVERFAEAFAPAGFRPEAFFPCYGLAEATLMASGGPSSTLPRVHPVDRAALARGRVVPADSASAAASALVGCGNPIPDTDAAIVDPESRRRCAPHAVGEIWLSGPSVATGYWNRPEESADTFGARIADDDAGPYLRTGDLGFLFNGDLYVTGRKKDIIIVGGQNFYPQDLEFEAERSQAGPALGRCAVFAIDVEGEERAVVLAEVRQVERSDSPVRKDAMDAGTAQEIVQSIRMALFERFSVAIHDVRLVRPGVLPRTTSGKLRRFACKERYLAGEFNEWAAP